MLWKKHPGYGFTIFALFKRCCFFPAMLLLAWATTAVPRCTASEDGMAGGRPMPDFGIFARTAGLGLPRWTAQRLTLPRRIRAVRLSWKRKCIGRPILPAKIGGLLPGGGFAPQDPAGGNTWRRLPRRS